MNIVAHFQVFCVTLINTEFEQNVNKQMLTKDSDL